MSEAGSSAGGKNGDSIQGLLDIARDLVSRLEALDLSSESDTIILKEMRKRLTTKIDEKTREIANASLEEEDIKKDNKGTPKDKGKKYSKEDLKEMSRETWLADCASLLEDLKGKLDVPYIRTCLKSGLPESVGALLVKSYFSEIEAIKTYDQACLVVKKIGDRYGQNSTEYYRVVIATALNLKRFKQRLLEIAENRKPISFDKVVANETAFSRNKANRLVEMANLIINYPLFYGITKTSPSVIYDIESPSTLRNYLDNEATLEVKNFWKGVGIIAPAPAPATAPAHGQ